jgi:putative inorganic carbon (hco3(-)) transporter
MSGMLHSMVEYLRRQLFLRKLNSVAGAIVLGVLAVVLAGMMVYINYWLGPAVIAVFAGLIVLVICLVRPLMGFYITMFISCFAFYPQRIVDRYLPISISIEFLIFATYLGLLLKKKKDPADKAFYSAPSTLAMLIFMIFCLVEVFNPNMYSVLGWFLYTKRFLEFILIYYMSFKLIDDMPKMRAFIRFWFVMSLVIALYTCKQQWIGFFGFEWNYLNSDPRLYVLYFQGGEWRKFSFLSDPAALGIEMGSAAVFTMILGMGEQVLRKKWIYFMSALAMVLAMEYTGTRTATFVLMGGIVFYIMMTFNQRGTFYFLVLSTVVFFSLLFAPVDNPTLNRFRSTFRGSDEGSLIIRNVNRHKIQPYIYSHPMGGGPMTSATEGLIYNPGHPLAGFPPDSGFLKLAIETGWTGFGITMISYLLFICQGIHYYFKARNKEIRIYMLAFLSGIVVYILAQYTQVAIGQFPGTFFFYPVASLLIRLMQLDAGTAEKKLQITQ